MEQLESQLGAPDVTLDAGLLDRIDEIVPPGGGFNTSHYRFTPPEIAESRLRRR
jgi:hypothetical protein